MNRLNQQNTNQLMPMLRSSFRCYFSSKAVYGPAYDGRVVEPQSTTNHPAYLTLSQRKQQIIQLCPLAPPVDPVTGRRLMTAHNVQDRQLSVLVKTRRKWLGLA
ncbi:hypothetical protein EVAR_10063_1 [Eumeta japonica]|uniref:Uncharacterized protein n=1 Tax=Eumeta variegata TaxID=151549 RepID=A0A4C1TR69_EUMVA|nr:hypothetical protein EVAR_10063_1 [Eumeta japonica]